MATRVYWAISALGVAPDGSSSATESEFVSGIQSVGITTTFNLEQVFQLGQLSLYQDVEEVPDVEVTVERVLDGFDCMYTRVMGTGTISENQDVKKDIYFNVYSDANNEVGDGNPEAGVHCSGMYCSSATFTFPSDGNLTESISLVGNHATWSSSAQIGSAPSTAMSGSVKRRQNVTNISAIRSALSELASDAQITNITVSVDFGREQINVLGQKLPYHRYVTYPVEVTCEVETLARGSANVSAAPEQDNTSEQSISIVGGGHTFNLGSKNKLQSYTYGGGSTGGENATITYSYRNFNDLTVTETASG
jgi:hypothetical protein